ncbi:phosphatase PAP2 family protein [Natronococcus sp. A-GB1]|uniref:phosphatase PAP2 family protein n=1 Tax=Natronococcus sp. A-GB1 TaxID=3037648 RepID=UPI00241C8F87|nr:phosphatase PAP2 family protein [Natronococcus sp. A-GB1]MDG5759859.1 phosphatase PAP2 family protein [Natronococcus sp. A-GB1]
MSRSLGVMEALRTVLPEWSLEAFVAATLFGDLLFVAPALVLFYLVDVGSSIRRGRREEPLCSDRTVSLIATIFGGLSLVVLLESMFALPRPPAEYHVIEPSEFGFPSGHTMAATVFWGALALWLPRGRRSVRIGIAGAIVALVAVSRLALGVHYLVDVVASVVFGAVYLATVGRLALDRPLRAFLAALGIALAAAVATGVNDRAFLALVGTAVGLVGWWLVEHPVIRRRVYGVYDRLIPDST